MHEIIDLFPLAFYVGQVSCHKELKEKVESEIKNYPTECYTEKKSSTLFHNESRFQMFFSSLKENVDFYISTLGVDHTKLSYHVLKSWVDHKPPESEEVFNINENRYDMIFPSVSHWHPYSDISFIYYFSADETSDQLFVENCRENQNDYDALLEMSTVNNIMTEWNKYNSKHHIFSPEEGKVVIFPSKLNHSVRRCARRNGDRISIAGDIIVTTCLNPGPSKDYRNPENQTPQASTHPSLWKELG